MTPEERSWVLALVKVPGRKSVTTEQFLEGFGATDGGALGLTLLRDAAHRRDPIDVELALVVCFNFGFADAHLPVLVSLAFDDWHERHEDVASALQDLSSPASVEALGHLADWIPNYLEWDDARALATKAIWALGSTPGEAAHQALVGLSQSSDSIVADGARAQLER